jgi:hypothetical protein
MSSYSIEAVEGEHHHNSFPHIANLAHSQVRSHQILNPPPLSLFRRVANVGVGTSLFEGPFSSSLRRNLGNC